MLPRNTPELVTKENYTKCFACGRDNPVGLKLKFNWDGQTARAKFVPGEWHQGWPGVIHGGIISVVLDEAMTYVPYFQGLHCVTGRLEVRWKSHAVVGEDLLVSANATRQTRKLIECQSVLTRPDGSIVAEGKALFYVINNTNQTHDTDKD
jgi:acyl-coenzyme A thioesterase PaaI-like protein